MRLLYFAWLRERLNRSEEEVSPPASVVTVEDLIDWLAGREDGGSEAFGKRTLIRAAIDARVANPKAPIAGASVIALFPPMTGG